MVSGFWIPARDARKSAQKLASRTGTPSNQPSPSRDAGKSCQKLASRTGMPPYHPSPSRDARKSAQKLASRTGMPSNHPSPSHDAGKSCKKLASRTRATDKATDKGDRQGVSLHCKFSQCKGMGNIPSKFAHFSLVFAHFSQYAHITVDF